MFDVVRAAGAAAENAALAMSAATELKILGAVVRLVPVDVVDGLVGIKMTTEHPAHHDPVFFVVGRGVLVPAHPRRALVGTHVHIDIALAV